jgi:hypothetical protein
VACGRRADQRFPFFASWASAAAGSSGWEKRKPWALAHFSERRASSCSGVSTPSAVTPSPRLWARAMIVFIDAPGSLPAGIRLMKDWSTLSGLMGRRGSCPAAPPRAPKSST